MWKVIKEILIIVIPVAVVLWISWMVASAIASSNLDPWMKYWLLH